MRRIKIAFAMLALSMLGGAAGVAGAQVPSQADRGRELFVDSCSGCHGVDGRGTAQGPALTNAGAASADFMLTTGRMPLDDPGHQPVRKPGAFGGEQVRLITDFVAALGPGPAVPKVRPSEGDVVAGQNLFSANCAACHSSAGAGGAVGSGMEAPRLTKATPVQIAEAVRIGPGTMPVFNEQTLSPRDVDSIVAYLLYLRKLPDRGGLGLGRRGPIAEGFIAWLIGIGAILGVSRWIEPR